jgi:hypothetical protein
MVRTDDSENAETESTVIAKKPQLLPTRHSRFEPFERALLPVLNEVTI